MIRSRRTYTPRAPVMRRYRADFGGSTGDVNLIAKFFRALNSYEAMRLAKQWGGSLSTPRVTEDRS